MSIKFVINSFDAATQPYNSQNVGYFRASSHAGERLSEPPKKIDYQTLLFDERDTILAMNYQDTRSMTPVDVYGAAVGITSQTVAGASVISVYKREIWEDGGEELYQPVELNYERGKLLDFNIANGRTYEYTAYPSTTVSEGASKRAVVSTNWQYWSLTELHSVENNKKVFTASPDDIWIFKYNLTLGEQTQNISKTQQDNLTAYPVFSHGPKNNISSTVSCLLGSEMMPVVLARGPAEYDNATGKWVRPLKQYQQGGYRERRRFTDVRWTSNEKVDMLNAWRQIAFSGNPKLLKDTKGQKFLIQITQSSNSTQETWGAKRPETISFSWVEIGSLEGVTITGEIEGDIIE